MHFDTTAIHAGAEPDEATASLAPPIHLSTTFQHGIEGEALHGYTYVRDGNPTQSRLETALAAIEGGESALAFASGMAAASALMQSLSEGAHIIFPSDGYYGLRALSNEYLPRWGFTTSLVAIEDLDAVRRALRPETRAIICESPSNPLMNVADLAALAKLAHEANALLIVDNTFASPAIQNPIALGADVVLHSTTKYLGGHSDVQGGALILRRSGELLPALERTRQIGGGVASPFNSWLVLRGIRTLAARMRVHCENARAVAAFLAQHSSVEAVHYPGLASHPGHEIAKRQMSDFGGMLSFRVRGGRQAAFDLLKKVKLFTVATSLGGVESLIEHRASVEGPTTMSPENLLRVSIGLEHYADLIEDLRQAL